MASEEIAQLADGDLHIAAENGRTVLKGTGFYFSFDPESTKGLFRALASASVRAAGQNFAARMQEHLKAVNGGER